jgi:hypothetical protein
MFASIGADSGEVGDEDAFERAAATVDRATIAEHFAQVTFGSANAETVTVWHGLDPNRGPTRSTGQRVGVARRCRGSGGSGGGLMRSPSRARMWSSTRASVSAWPRSRPKASSMRRNREMLDSTRMTEAAGQRWGSMP